MVLPGSTLESEFILLSRCHFLPIQPSNLDRPLGHRVVARKLGQSLEVPPHVLGGGKPPEVNISSYAGADVAGLFFFVVQKY